MNEYIVGFDVDLYKPVEVSVFAPDEYTAVMNATFKFQVKHEQDLCYLNKIEFVKEVPAEDEDKAEPKKFISPYNFSHYTDCCSDDILNPLSEDEIYAFNL